MELDLDKLTPIQLDILKELTNIGGGNAATVLSQMVNRLINMEVPMVSIYPYHKVFDTIKREEDEVVAVSILVLGDTPGSFLFILEREDAFDLIQMMTGQKPEALDSLSISALQEVCNILCSSYINAVSRMLNLTLISSVPAYVEDMFGAILSSTYIEAGQIDEKLLIIENNFLEENHKIKAHLFFVPHPGSLEKIFTMVDTL